MSNDVKKWVQLSLGRGLTGYVPEGTKPGTQWYTIDTLVPGVCDGKALRMSVFAVIPDSAQIAAGHRELVLGISDRHLPPAGGGAASATGVITQFRLQGDAHRVLFPGELIDKLSRARALGSVVQKKPKEPSEAKVEESSSSVAATEPPPELARSTWDVSRVPQAPFGTKEWLTVLVQLNPDHSDSAAIAGLAALIQSAETAPAALGVVVLK